MSRVCKVGGSLLDFPGLPAALRQWLDGQDGTHSVLIAGGGSLADQIRRFDERFQISDEAGHWLAVRSMGVTARMLAELVPEATLLDEFPVLAKFCQSTHPAAVAVFDVESFLRTVEPRLPGFTLPRDWTATSDSIAARVAQALGAKQLVLWKSSAPPSPSLAECTARGYVDPCFERAAAGCHDIQAIDARSPQLDPWPITP